MEKEGSPQDLKEDLNQAGNLQQMTVTIPLEETKKDFSDTQNNSKEFVIIAENKDIKV